MGAGPVLDIAQNYSAGSLTGVLFTVMALWMVWPIICGFLGASRGGVGSGIMHGIMWGPVALPIVLLSGKKHTCPTCGKKTLSKADAESLSPNGHSFGFAQPPTAVARPCEVPNEALFVANNTTKAVKAEPVPPVQTAEQREEVVAAACAGYDETETARLRQWLNGEPS